MKQVSSQCEDTSYRLCVSFVSLIVERLRQLPATAVRKQLVDISRYQGTVLQHAATMIFYRAEEHIQQHRLDDNERYPIVKENEIGFPPAVTGPGVDRQQSASSIGIRRTVATTALDTAFNSSIHGGLDNDF